MDSNESGSRTASGARFDDRLPTAAHRYLSSGTKLRVSHRGRSVVVTVNDRGPYVRGRVLDLALAPRASSAWSDLASRTSTWRSSIRKRTRDKSSDLYAPLAISSRACSVHRAD
jgi:rare lipoprotein A